MARRKLTKDESKRVEWIFQYCASRVSDTALEFMISLEVQYKRDGLLSDAQLDALERIYKETE